MLLVRDLMIHSREHRSSLNLLLERVLERV